MDPNQHRSVDPEKFQVGANGWKKYNNQETGATGAAGAAVGLQTTTVMGAGEFTTGKSGRSPKN